MDTLAETISNPATRSQFSKTIFNEISVPQIAIAKNTNTAFSIAYTAIVFLYQQFNQKQIRKFTGSQPTVHFVAADNCGFFVTTTKAKTFQDNRPSISITNFKNHYVLVFELTSFQEATEKFCYTDVVGEPLTLELNSTSLPEQVSELVVLGKQKSLDPVDEFGVTNPT